MGDVIILIYFCRNLKLLQMKTQIIFIISIALLFSCKPSTSKSDGEYEVIIKAEGVYDGLRAYLLKTENGRNRTATDTAIVFNGAFRFKGNIKGAEMRTLTIDGVRGQTSFFIEPGLINVKLYVTTNTFFFSLASSIALPTKTIDFPEPADPLIRLKPVSVRLFIKFL